MRLKPLLVVLSCIVLVRLIRHFMIAPWMSLGTIGAVRHAFGRSTDEDGVLHADIAQNVLFKAFDGWIMVDVIIDVAVLVFVIAVLFVSTKREKLTGCPKE